MLFSPQKKCRKDFSISINGQNIHQTAEAKYLGAGAYSPCMQDMHCMPSHLARKENNNSNQHM